MRILYCGTGDIGLPALRAIAGAVEHELVGIVTQPDRPAGRDMKPRASAIKCEAVARGLPVFQPERIRHEESALSALSPDVMVVMAYGQILRDNILTLARKAIINLHASLLPRYRGAACIQAAIDAGDRETGVTALHVVCELDAGDVILAQQIPIAADETGGSLHDRLALLAADVLAAALTKLADGTAPRIPQDAALSSYVPKLGRDAGRLDWTQAAAVLERRIRAYDPWPGTFTLAIADGRESRLKIYPPTRVVDCLLAPGQIAGDGGKWIVGCGAGAIELTSVQPDGGKRMTAADYLRGRKPGTFH